MIIKLQNGNILKLSKEKSDYLNWGKFSPKQKQQIKINKADNARKWKHKKGGFLKGYPSRAAYDVRLEEIARFKKGGKAFVEGVNVLDSNPNIYRKKKIRKGKGGTKLQQIGQWISNNKDSISGIISGVSSLVGSGNTYNKKKDALDAQRKAFENSYADQMLDNIDLGQYAAQLKQMNPDSNYSSIDMGYWKNLLRQQAANKAKAYSNQWYQTQLNQLGNEQQQNQHAAAKAISDGVVSMMSNKNKV